MTAVALPVDAGEQGVLELEWVLPSGLPARPRPAAALRVVPRPAPEVDALEGPDPHVVDLQTGRVALPDPGQWAAQLVQGVVEVLAGERPLSQLVKWLSPQVYDDLRQHVHARPGRPAGSAPMRRSVRAVHLCRPAPDVVEAAVVVDGGRRARAAALRLERDPHRWRCTRFTLL